MLCVDAFIFLEVFLEAFPISSSGHALLIGSLFERYSTPALCSQLYSVVNHLGHGPIAVIVTFFFARRYMRAVRHVRLWFPIALKLCAFGFVADFITAVVYKWYTPLSVTCVPYGFAVTAVVLYLTRYARTVVAVQRRAPVYMQAVVCGLAQAAALLPGISRFGMTYACTRFFGFSSYRAFQWSFVLGLPVNYAGFAKGLHDGWQAGILDKLLNHEMALVMLVSGVLLGVNMNLMEQIARHNSVWKFSYYLIPIAACAWLLV